MKVLVIGDVHHKIEHLEAGIKKFREGKYDKCIQLGDLVDHWFRPDKDGIDCVNMALSTKEEFGDNYIYLWGNHELSYLCPEKCKCSGYRDGMARVIGPLLTENRNKLHMAYQIGNYLFTHAGVSIPWYEKHKIVIESFDGTLADKLNNAFNSHYFPIFTEVGEKRGGMRYDAGGPVWVDKEELESYGPVRGYHHVVGHTAVPYIHTVNEFRDKKYNNTSVTFCDVLDKGPHFKTLEI